MKKNKLLLGIAIASVVGTPIACTTPETSETPDLPKDLPYKVEYYLENEDGSYSIDESLTCTGNGTSGTVASAEVQAPAGFEFDSEKV